MVVCTYLPIVVAVCLCEPVTRLASPSPPSPRSPPLPPVTQVLLTLHSTPLPPHTALHYTHLSLPLPTVESSSVQVTLPDLTIAQAQGLPAVWPWAGWPVGLSMHGVAGL